MIVKASGRTITALHWLGVCFLPDLILSKTTILTVFTWSSENRELLLHEYESLHSRWEIANVIGFAERQDVVFCMFDRC